MDFKFIGAVRVQGNAVLEGFFGDHEEVVIAQRYLTLQKDTSNISFSGDGQLGVIVEGDQRFTVWQPQEDQSLLESPDAQTRFILRAANGMYITAQNGRLTANTPNRDEALIFTRFPPQAEVANAGNLLNTASGILMMSYVGDTKFAGQLEERFDLPDVSSSGLFEAIGFQVRGVFMIRQLSSGFKFEDITPSLQAIRQGHGPVDLSWLYWPNVNLENSKLPNSNLRGAVLSGSLLRNTQLSNSDLRDADFSQTDLQEANLAGAQVSGSLFNQTSLTNGNLTGVDFSKAKVMGANFMGSNLTDANFARCDLSDAVYATFKLITDSFFWRDVIFEGTDFSSTILNNDRFPAHFFSDLPSNFTDSNRLSDYLFTHPFGDKPPKFSTNSQKPTKFRSATLPFRLINLTWSCLDLTDATINGIPQDLSGLKASYLIFPKIDLSDHILKNAVFDNAELTGANFKGADLTNASFRGAKLSSVDFSSAKITGAVFDDADLTGADFSSADARVPAGQNDVAGAPFVPDGASFIGAKLGEANFSYATLTGSNFHSAQLGNVGEKAAADLGSANMRGVVLDNANLDDCDLSNVNWYGVAARDAEGKVVQNASATNASLQNAKFGNANLAGLILSTARLETTDFTNAILIGAQLDGAVATDAVFQNAHLQGANFTRAQLQGAKLGGASVAFEHGVSLFALKKDAPNLSNLIADLNNAAVSDQVTGVFRANHYPLLDNPSITVDTGGGWTVSNNATALPTTNAYSSFKILGNANDGLKFYGSGFWVTQVDDDNQTQTIPLLYSATILNPQTCILSEGTTLPYGHQYRASSHDSWEQMMTAPEPPEPPPCVSTDDDWSCPDNQPSS